jgi:Flp pilus assembly secretin CpaC
MTIRSRAFFAPTCGVIAGLTGLLLASSPARAAGIEVPLDQVRIVTFNGPVKTVFVGNPLIADITVIDPTHVFILGKNFGTTNVVALDAKGRETVNEQITVLERPGSTVTLQRGAGRVTLNCSSAHCEATPTPGDDSERYSAVSGQIDNRESASVKAASGQ